MYMHMYVIIKYLRIACKVIRKETSKKLKRILVSVDDKVNNSKTSKPRGLYNS